jgi:hypothetical protein
MIEAGKVQMDRLKVFGVGWPKTGTTTLGKHSGPSVSTMRVDAAIW